MTAPAANLEEIQRTVEVRGAADPRLTRCVRGRPLTYYWPWIQQQVRSVMLPPHERVTDRSVSWIWCESGGQAPLSKAELSQLRVKLQQIESEFRELSESAAGTAANEVLGEVRSAMSALAASLAAKSDAQLAAFTARTTSGIRVHSWSLLKPPETRSVRTKDPDSSRAGLPDTEPGSPGESWEGKHALETEHLNADRRADHGSVGRGSSTQKSAKAKWIWCAGIGVAFVAFLLAGILMRRGRQSQMLVQNLVPNFANDSGVTDGAVEESAIGITATDHHDAEGGSGNLEAAHTSWQVQRSFRREKASASTETLLTAALAEPTEIENLSSSYGGDSTHAQDKIVPERPLVLPSIDGAAPNSFGAAISNESGLPIVSGSGGGSPSVNGAGGSAGASATEAINGSAGVTRRASAESEGISGGRSLPVAGEGTAPLPLTDSSAYIHQALPHARRISQDDNFGKSGRALSSQFNQRPSPTAHREDALPASGKANAEATSASDSEQKREAAISEGGETAVAFRKVHIRISPWTFAPTRDTVVSTRPLPVGLADDSEVKRQALLSERQAHAPRALSSAELSWGIAFDCPEGVSESDWKRSGGFESAMVRREGTRVLIPLAKGSVPMNGRFQWQEYDSQNVLLSIDADASEGISLVFRDGLQVAVWISAEPGKSTERPGESNVDAARMNTKWITSTPTNSPHGNVANRIGALPWLEIPLDTPPGAKSPVRMSLLDEDSGWAWQSELRVY